MENKPPEDVKTVTAGSIVLWILGIGIAVSGLVTGNITSILAGLILLPIINHLSKKYLKRSFSGGARFMIAIILMILGATVATSLDEAQQKVTENQPAQQEQTQPNNGAAFCTMVGQYLAIVNGDQVSVTDEMVVAGLKVIAEKSQGTRFETTANRALAQGNASDAQGLIASLNQLARDCGLK